MSETIENLLGVNQYYYLGGIAAFVILAVIIFIIAHFRKGKNKKYNYDMQDQPIEGIGKLGTNLNKFVTSGEAGIEALQESFQKWTNVDTELERTCQEKIEEIKTAKRHLLTWKAVAEQGLTALDEQEKDIEDSLMRIQTKKRQL